MSETITVPIPGNGAAGDAAAGSVLAQLRARAAAAREQRTLDLPVGGPFADTLVIQYHALPIDEMDRYAEMADGALGKPSTVSIDMMVSACATVLFRTADGELHDLGVGLDSRLAEALDAPLPASMDYSDLTPREVVSIVFTDNLFVLGPHLNALAAWMQSGGEDPGEAPAAT